MAVIVWRGQECKRVEPGNLKAWEAQGWSTRNPNRPRPTYEGGPNHIGSLDDIPADATPLEAQEIVLGKMRIKVT